LISEKAAATTVLSYLRDRAVVEGVEMTVTPDWLVWEAKKRGVSLFDMMLFGVRIASDGSIASDDREPEPGFLGAWNSRQRGLVH
jgi:hypothetical protein